MPVAIFAPARRAAIWLATAVLTFGLQGCMAGSRSIPAKDALALSASALAGSENYAFAGELSLYDAGGEVGSRSAFEGQVTGHGNLKLQWKPSELSAMETGDSASYETYRPLQLLEALKGDDATAAYAEKPTQSKPVKLVVRLDDEVAKRRVAEELRQQLAMLRSTYATGSKETGVGKAAAILSEAEARMEAAIKSLKVRTVCYWTADPKNWFPSQLKEESQLSYEWEGRSLNEKRSSETNFHNDADGDTIKGS
ncbi:hypothetical protein ACFPPD_14320 [Cohnella suwonensis]|uniref:Lipoprotein n=1 Tax=Cohnella suwonensis TaxID=696072 RepID=A0ABW0LVK9_9BACL